MRSRPTSQRDARTVDSAHRPNPEEARGQGGARIVTVWGIGYRFEPDNEGDLRIWRGLGPRIIIGSILCGLLGLLVSGLLIRHTAREAVLTGSRPTFGARSKRRAPPLQQAPERWSLSAVPARASMRTTRRRSLRATPMRLRSIASLYRRLQTGEPNPAKVQSLRRRARAAMLLRAAPSGPCSSCR